jgi:hypothetical protein
MLSTFDTAARATINYFTMQEHAFVATNDYVQLACKHASMWIGWAMRFFSGPYTPPTDAN